MLVNLFPSPILVIDHAFHNPDLVATVASSLVEKATKQPDWDCTIQTSFAMGGRDHTVPALRPFIDVVEELAEQYAGIYFKRQPVVRHCWSNVADKGQYQEYHTHLGTEGVAFSGVYYAQSDEQERLTFHSPFQNIVMLNTPPLQQIPAKQNRIIFFPSYLAHSFKGWDRPMSKISIAFNFSLK